MVSNETKNAICCRPSKSLMTAAVVSLVVTELAAKEAICLVDVVLLIVAG